MLLCLSSVCSWPVFGQELGLLVGQVGVDLAGDVALEAADDLSFAEAFGGAALDVVDGGLVAPHSDQGDDVEGAVGGAVASSAESVSSGGAAAAGGLWRDAADLREGCLAVDPAVVVTGGDQELAGDLGADAVQFDELGGCATDQGIDLAVEELDLLVETLPAAGQVTQGDLGSREQKSLRDCGQAEKVSSFGTQRQAALTALSEFPQSCSLKFPRSRG